MHDLNEMSTELPRATQTKEMDGHQLRPRRSCTSFLIPVLDTSAMIVIPQVEIISSHHHSKADHVHPWRLEKWFYRSITTTLINMAWQLQPCRNAHITYIMFFLYLNLVFQGDLAPPWRVACAHNLESFFQGSSIDSIYIWILIVFGFFGLLSSIKRWCRRIWGYSRTWSGGMMMNILHSAWLTWNNFKPTVTENSSLCRSFLHPGAPMG